MRRHIGAVLLLAAPALALGQTTGNSAAGQTIWTDFSCASCHSLESLRDQVTARAPNAGTLNFSKLLAALNAALTGTDLDNMATGMSGYAGLLSTTNRADVAAYLAGLAAPAPIVTYSPTGGAVFPATAAGASATVVVTLTNTGTANLVVATNNAVTIATGGDAADFRVSSSSCPGVTLQPGQGNCTINVTFQPAAGASASRSASLGVSHNAGTTLVPMSGTVGAGSGTTPPVPSGGSAVPPGGGGALPLLALMLLLAAGVRRRMR